MNKRFLVGLLFLLLPMCVMAGVTPSYVGQFTTPNFVPAGAVYTNNTDAGQPVYALTVIPGKTYWGTITNLVNLNNIYDPYGNDPAAYPNDGITYSTSGFITPTSNVLWCLGGIDQLLGSAVEESLYPSNNIVGNLTGDILPGSTIDPSVIAASGGVTTNGSIFYRLTFNSIQYPTNLSVTGTSGQFTFTAIHGSFAGWSKGDEFAITNDQYIVLKIVDTTHAMVSSMAAGPITHTYTTGATTAGTNVSYYPSIRPINDVNQNFAASLLSDGGYAVLEQDGASFANSGAIWFFGSGSTFKMALGQDGTGWGFWSMFGLTFSVSTNASQFALQSWGAQSSSAFGLKPVSSIPFTGAQLGANGMGMWNSNGVWYISKSSNGSSITSTTLIAQ